jgi:S1-C subfamily serine protease
MKMDPTQGVRIAAVDDGSAAAIAGIVAGEDVTHVNGQFIASIADIQWALNDVPNKDETVTVRTSKSGGHEVKLAAGWKKYDASWRGSMWSVSPRFPVWTPELTAEERNRFKLPEDKLGMSVRWINQGEPGGKAAMAAGLREGDAVVAVGTETTPMSPQQFNLYVKLNYRVGDKLPLTILREGKLQVIEIPLVE